MKRLVLPAILAIFALSSALAADTVEVLLMSNEAVLLSNGEIWVLTHKLGWSNTGRAVPIPAHEVAHLPSSDRFVDIHNNGWILEGSEWVNYGPPPAVAGAVSKQPTTTSALASQGNLISYTVIKPDTVTVSILDPTSRVVDVLVDREFRKPGTYTIDYVLTERNWGFYIVQFIIGNTTTKTTLYPRR